MSKVKSLRRRVKALENIVDHLVADDDGEFLADLRYPPPTNPFSAACRKYHEQNEWWLSLSQEVRATIRDEFSAGTPAPPDFASELRAACEKAAAEEREACCRAICDGCKEGAPATCNSTGWWHDDGRQCWRCAADLLRDRAATRPVPPPDAPEPRTCELCGYVGTHDEVSYLPHRPASPDTFCFDLNACDDRQRVREFSARGRRAEGRL